ncbi:MAG: hypothetical protein H0V24_05045 [Chloroflexia bacterium]|nr:hypothetical protein [Chloroflexia bacterium]
MDPRTFDRWTAAVAHQRGRRFALRVLAGGLLGGILAQRGVALAAAQAADSDGDGHFDADEVNVYGTDPYNFDTDGDGVGEGAEVYYGTDPRGGGGGGAGSVDTDGDGLYDADEVNVYYTDPYTYDTDRDGVGDGAEIYSGTDSDRRPCPAECCVGEPGGIIQYSCPPGYDEDACSVYCSGCHC